jgi:hypothetical protein
MARGNWIEQNCRNYYQSCIFEKSRYFRAHKVCRVLLVFMYFKAQKRRSADRIT